MLFYFVRHGQTVANLRGLLAGAGVDIPLTELGHEQARALARRIQKSIGHPIHRIYASDMIRARQTGEYLANVLHLPLEIETDFREWHLGEWENEPFEKFGHLLLGEGEPREGESRKTFYSRIENAWKARHHEDEPYVIVAHGGVWLAMQDFLKIPRFKIENCQLIKVQIKDGQWNAELLV